MSNRIARNGLLGWGPFNARKATNHIRLSPNASLGQVLDASRKATSYLDSVLAASLPYDLPVPHSTHTLVMKRAKQLARRFANSHGANITPRSK